MKKTVFFFFFLFLSYSVSSQNSISEDNRSSEIRVSLMLSTSLANLEEAHLYGNADQTYLLTGFDVKIIVNSKKKKNISFLMGAFFQKGSNISSSQYDNINNVLIYTNSSSTYGGGIYFGPQVSTHYKYINLRAYLAGGVFSFHDEIISVKNRIGLYQNRSDFTSLGTKAGVNISFVYKWISLTGGYQVFVTAGDQSTLLYHGIEVGLGLKF